MMTFTTKPATPNPPIQFMDEDEWDHELDVMGIFAPLEQLEAHLKLAPPGAANKELISDWIDANRMQQENEASNA